MSRIAKNPVNIPEKTEVNITETMFTTKGLHGEISIKIPNGYKVVKKDTSLTVEVKKEYFKNNPVWGTLRSLVANAIQGVSVGFTKTLELNGTGYRASIANNVLKLQLGYSHDVNMNVPQGLKIECSKQNIIKLFSYDKDLLGKTAAEIRSYRKPEPFKGKGIKYEGEFIFRKEGKKK